MFGQYKHTVDAKGRLIIPSKYREELGMKFYISESPDFCLTLYTAEEWQRVMDHFRSLPMTTGRSLRYFLANVWECEPDKQGRFLLPEDFSCHSSFNAVTTSSENIQFFILAELMPETIAGASIFLFAGIR